MSIDAVLDILLADERWKCRSIVGDIGVGAITALAYVGEAILVEQY